MEGPDRVDEIERRRVEEMLLHERAAWRRGIRFVAGVDEAGRGPLAGPVVAAAVVFQEGVFIPGMNDSKKLLPERRERLYGVIREKALAVGTGVVSEKAIDRMNILQASFEAMRQAIAGLVPIPEYLLVDGRTLPGTATPQTALVRGDSRSFSIAAASVVAKVTRDRLMVAYDREFPEYGFAQHKGYGTRRHVEAILRHGLCDIHRRSFRVRGWRG